jgi:hypothetical protein
MTGPVILGRDTVAPLPELASLPTCQLANQLICLVLANWSTCQRVNYRAFHWSTEPLSLRASSVRPLSPCHRALVSPRGFAAPTFAQELHSDLHLCTSRPGPPSL